MRLPVSWSMLLPWAGGEGCYEWMWIVETLVNHEFMNKCDCICIRIHVLGSMLLSLSYTALLHIGKYTAQTKHKKRSAEYYSILSSVFQLFRDRTSVYWGQPEWRRKSEHDEESSWLCHSFFRSLWSHIVRLFLCFAHNSTHRMWEKLPFGFHPIHLIRGEDDDERIVDSTLKLT